MEVTLSAELQTKLERIAEDRGTSPQDLAREAIERLVDYDDWFVREVEKGLTQIESGQTRDARRSRRTSQQASGR